MSATLPRMDDRLFITERVKTRAIGKYWGLSSQRLAKIMKQAMEAAGIPDEFLPHSARHAGQAYLKSQCYSDDDVMARANMSARTYVTHYRRRVRRAAPEAPSGTVVAGAGGGSIWHQAAALDSVRGSSLSSRGEASRECTTPTLSE